MKEENEPKNLIKINVVNGISGDYQVWDYMSMKYMDTFTGEIDAQLFWVSYDHNEGYEDWGIATHPEREKANGYLCKQVYLADFSIIDRPTPPVETKTAEDENEEWLWYAKFDDLGWSLAPLYGKSQGQACELAKRKFEVVYTNNIEAYHAQYTPSAKSVEVEEALESSQQGWIDVNERLPENESDLYKNDGFTESSEMVLVLTDCHSIMNNNRVKMTVGKKTWEWVMSIHEEQITHWTKCIPLPTPTNKDTQNS